MALIKCNKVDARYHESSFTNPYKTIDGIRYGHDIWYVNHEFYTSYVLFDIRAVLKNKIEKVTLVRIRSRLWVSAYIEGGIQLPDPTTTGIKVTYLGFVSTSASSTIALDAIKYVGTSAAFPLDKAATGTLSNVINLDLSKHADGYIGIMLDSSDYGVADDSDMYPNVEVSYIPALAPINLLPQSTQNPRGAITFSWWHNPNPTVSDDPQTGSELTIWQDGVTPIVIAQNNTSNTYTLAANTFTQYKKVYFKVRTRTHYNEWGQYTQSQFELGTTPPLAPTLVFPLNVSVNGTNGVPLEWSYNSPYDTFPTRFDVRYRVDGGSWITKTNYSSGNNPAYQSIMTGSITSQSKVEWQVLAYGALGDAGSWSDADTFFTIGIPNAPTIVRVSNSNRPAIYFSATKLMAWELEIRRNDIKIYETGVHAFDGSFNHITNRLFDNGNYVARMRIINEYGLVSDWGVLPFAINTVAPSPLELQIVRNLDFFIRLRFNNSGKTVYIYRSEYRQNKYKRIGMTKDVLYDDYTARPKQQYEYFVRTVSSDYSFADSNVETMELIFIHTTIAEYDTPQNMLKLWKQLGGKPQKDISNNFEKTLTNFVGRESPVLQIGTHSDKSLSLSFYCSLEEHECLEALQRSHKTLILRDWRLGVIYGTINGSISATREMEGCIVSFVFTQIDFDEEVELI